MNSEDRDSERPRPARREPDSSTSTAMVRSERDEVRRIVSVRTIARARAVAEALFLTEDGPPPSERLDWLGRELEDFLARAGARSRLVVGLALFAVGLLAPLLSFRFVSLASMLPGERARALGKLEDIFGAPVLAVKALLCVIYYEHPDAARFVGFDGECLVGSGSHHLPTAP